MVQANGWKHGCCHVRLNTKCRHITFLAVMTKTQGHKGLKLSDYRIYTRQAFTKIKHGSLKTQKPASQREGHYKTYRKLNSTEGGFGCWEQ